MLPQRWDEVKQKLQTALELPIEERLAFLRAIDEADPELCQEVEALLAFHEAAGTEFLKTRVPNLLAAISDESNPIVGQMLGPYEIRELIGAGGMGEVYRAHDPRLGRDVAIKVLPLLMATDPDRQRRFEQEARAAAALNHPNILAIHDLGCSSNRHYVVTELLEGETLRARLRRGALSVSHATRILLQIAQGLSAAHAKGIVHRDLKPENIFITSDSNSKILDFGLAKLLAPPSNIQQPASHLDETVTGLIMGTPGYMSPEQVRGQAVDQRTDIFALGAIAYEMLSGRRAFRGESSADTISAILSHAPPALSGPQSSVPTGLDRLVQRCLEKSQGDRFQSVREFSSALEAISESGSIPLPTSRRPVLLTGAGVIATFLLFAWWLRSPAPAPKVLATKQITRDGVAKTRLVTDGSRLYTTEGSGANNIVQASVMGGETSPILNPFTNVDLLEISPDHSQLLVVNFVGTEPEDQFWLLPLPTGSPRRMANLVGHGGAWSPDGHRLVFVQGSDLYMANADGTDIHRLIAVSGTPFRPGFSPDGARIRFTILDAEKNSRSLWEIRSDGTDLHPVLAGWHAVPTECCGCWSPDGHYYFFLSDTPASRNLWALREPDGFFRGRSRAPFQLTTGPISFHDPVSSPDGKKLFVNGLLARAELVRYDPQSHQFVPFLSGISAGELDFSRDGTWVTYVSYPEKILWRSHVDGSNRLQLTYPPVSAGLPRWSPDGAQIAYIDTQAGLPWRIFLISTQGGTPQEVVSEIHAQVDATWSPDGKQLAFGRTGFVGYTERLAIYVVDLNSRQVALIPGSENLYSPRWSPDGRHLAAMSSDSKKLLLFDFKTQKWSDWINETGVVGFPNWSSDGNYVYYDNAFVEHPTFRRVRVGQTRSELLFDLKGLRRYFSVPAGNWSGLAPDGSGLFVRDLSTDEIYALDLELP
jgi:eukaryotic-like serine/threonine-protein kinase